MCEIFPEVKSCCFFVDIRLGMLFISVLAIMTGVTGLSAIQQSTKASYSSLKNVTDIRKPAQIVSEISQIIPTGVTMMSWLFMLAGIILLFASISEDSEGFVQMFVWLTFLNVIVGFFMVIATGFECILKPVCILSKMDWLSSSILMIVIIIYLIVWVYFICVANTFVLNVYE